MLNVKYIIRYFIQTVTDSLFGTLFNCAMLNMIHSKLELTDKSLISGNYYQQSELKDIELLKEEEKFGFSCQSKIIIYNFILICSILF